MRLLAGRPPKVEKFKRKNDVQGLVRALGYEDLVRTRGGEVVDLGVDARRSAAEALAEMEGDAALDGLLRALGDPDGSVRIAAVHGLRERGGSAELASAAATWTDPRFEAARAEALEALVVLRDPVAPQRVVAALMERPEELDSESDGAVLRRLADVAARDSLAATVEDLLARLKEGTSAERVRLLLVWLAPASVEPLIRTLDDEAVRPDAIVALGASRDSRAVEKLCSILLGESEPAIRAAAAWALGEIRDPGAVEPLLVATGDREYEVRFEASRSFDKLGNAAIAVAMSALVRPALENGRAPVSEKAIETAVGEALLPPGGPPDGPPGGPPDGPPGGPPGGRKSTLSQAGPVLRRLLGQRPDA